MKTIPLILNFMIILLFSASVYADLTCVESWNCSDWAVCSEGMQTRTCTDATACGTTTSKPAESQTCDIPSSSSSSSSGGGSSGGSGEVNPNPPNESLSPSYDESFLLSKEDNHLELFEPIGSLYNYLGKNELNILADGTWKIKGEKYNYLQYLFFDFDNNKQNEIVKYVESDNNITADFFYIKNGEQIARYKLEFIKLAQSQVTDSLKDFEGTTIMIMGTEYTITQAIRPEEQNSIQLTLVDLNGESIELRDDDITNKKEDNSVVTPKNRNVIIIGKDNNEIFSINSIEIIMTATNDFYVSVDGKLSDVIVATVGNKEVLFTNNWDIEYKGLTEEATHEIKLKPYTTRRYELQVFDGDDNKIDIPIAYAEDNDIISLGKESAKETDGNRKALMLDESKPIYRNDYFILTGGNFYNGTAKSYLMQYKGSDATSKSNPKIKFKNQGSGEMLEYSVSTSGTVATIQLGGNSFAVTNASTTASDDFQIYVDLDTTYRDEVPDQSVDSIQKTLLEGETKRYRLGEINNYFVTLTYTDGTYAKFFINGESTSKLKVGETYALSDGNKITVLNILYQSFAGGEHSATFNITESNPFVEGYSHLGIGKERVPIIDSYGAEINIENSENKIDVTLSTPNPDDYENIEPSKIKLIITATPEHEVKAAINGITLVTPDDETAVSYGYTSMGSLITFEEPAADSDKFTMTYPKTQRFANVYILGGVKDTTPLEITNINPSNNSIINTDSTLLKITTNKKSACSYWWTNSHDGFGEVPSEEHYQDEPLQMSTTEGITHSSLFNTSSQSFVTMNFQCVDENKETVNKIVNSHVNLEDVCEPNWVKINSTCINDNIIVSYIDTNNCFAQTNLDSDNNQPENYSIICDEGINPPLLGGLDNIVTNVPNLNLFINNETNLTQAFTGVQEIKFVDGNNTFLIFNFDFTSNTLNLANITIKKNEDPTTGSLLIKGIELPAGETKTAYIEKIKAESNAICIINQDISTIAEMSSDCSQANEIKFNCPGTSGSYTCSIEGNMFKISGLQHSGVKEFYIAPPAPPTPPSGGGGGGGGGGYSSKPVVTLEVTPPIPKEETPIVATPAPIKTSLNTPETTPETLEQTQEDLTKKESTTSPPAASSSLITGAVIGISNLKNDPFAIAVILFFVALIGFSVYMLIHKRITKKVIKKNK